MHTNPIHRLSIFTTGGTIDKIYFDAKSNYEVGAPQIGAILEQLNVSFEFDVIPVMRKDSLEITDADRACVVSAVRAATHRHVLITHGTDTMVETATALKSIPDKVMVLTGALNPARFQDSDAVFNIGCAIGAVQTLPDGVYIAMNGCIWDPARVRKNRDANRLKPSRTLKTSTTSPVLPMIHSPLLVIPRIIPKSRAIYLIARPGLVRTRT